MQGTEDLNVQIVRYFCAFCLCTFLAALGAQVVVTGYRWQIETERQRLWVDTNQLRWESLCVDVARVHDLKFQDECSTYNEIRNASPAVLAAVRLASEYQLCDAENGGCRGLIGVLFGALLVIFAMVYLLRQFPTYFERRVRGVEDDHELHQLVYANCAGKSKIY